jgi:hypothetical protein
MMKQIFQPSRGFITNLLFALGSLPMLTKAPQHTKSPSYSLGNII